MSGEFKKNNKKIEWIMGGVLLVLISILAIRPGAVLNSKDYQIKETETELKTEIKKNGKCVVIDPGHGGDDPGKVGTLGTLEKDINLQIAQKLMQILEQKGYDVILTRKEDCHLGEDKFRKTADLNERCRIINEAFAENEQTIMISIHQNSFTKENVKGSQCFYYHLSEESKNLAELIQNRLNEQINVDREKKIKRNDNYYMLINSDCPGVIIECGFLSNPLEEEQLKGDEHQNLLAGIISTGIDEYFGKK